MQNELKNELKIEALNAINLPEAIELQKLLFPLENGSEDLKSSLTGNFSQHYSTLKYWLLKADERCVGMTGLYAYKEYPKDAWLAWFGVIESERSKGYATKLFEFTAQQAKEQGFDHFRLYTDQEHYREANKFYPKMGMIADVYDNPQDHYFKYSTTLIFSKSLTNTQTKLWGNKLLYLGDHDEYNHHQDTSNQAQPDDEQGRSM